MDIPNAPAPDYYKVLGVDKLATQDSLNKAYRRLALKYHPDKNDADTRPEFTAIAEAYDVLSNKQRRAIYDQFGAKGLADGVPERAEFAGLPGGYKFHGDADLVFGNFFGGKNPFADYFAAHYDPSAPSFGPQFGGLEGMVHPTTASPNFLVSRKAVERDLVLTLEELYNGATKKIKVTHRVFTSDERATTTEVDKVLQINVKRGWKAGTKITFPKEGDQGPNQVPADIVFVVREAPHVRFEREGDNLVYHTTVPLKYALLGSVIDIDTLDGRLIKVPVHEVVYHGFTKTVVNEGMPLSKCPDKKGLLVIKFDVKFPTYLDSEQKMLITQALN